MRNPHDAPAATSRPLHMRLLVLSLALAGFVILAAGCERAVPTHVTPEQPETVAPSLISQADQAWMAQNYAQAQSLYRRLLQGPGLTPAERELAWERYALSALENHDFAAALDAMPQWVQAIPQGQESTLWQDAYIMGLKGISDPYARQEALARMADDSSRPWRLRMLARLGIAGMYWGGGDIQTTLDILHQLSAEAATSQQRADLEQGLLGEAMYVDTDNLEALSLILGLEDQTTFPSTILQLEMARRSAVTGGDWQQAWQTIQALRAYITNTSLIDGLLASLEEERGQPVQGLALALPLTGPYSTFGWKVMRGAGVAQWEMAEQGLDVSIEVVNTESPDWLDALRALPQDYILVGGPLRSDKFDQIAAAGLLNQHAFFTFLRELTGMPEGQNAWRFFPSREDQVRSLLDLANTRYGFTSFGVLYPDESFGRDMAQLFQQEAAARGLVLGAMRAYPPEDSATWGDTVGEFVRGGNYQAIFVPGDWTHAEMLVPYFLYYDARHTLLMGPTLWGETLTRRSFVAEEDFKQTVFPGTWWPENNSTATINLTQRLQMESLGAPDFWVALGYDFVRFANQVGALEPGWTSRNVNDRLQNAQHMDWAMAPMTWDVQGRGSQKLLMLRPAQGGFTAIDETELRSRLR